MSKYTKGPWMTRGGSIFAPSCDSYNKDGMIAAVRYLGNAPDRISESKANCVLIAAAPEMAEMLLSMFSHISHGGPTRAEAESLLKKAGVIE